MIIHEGFSLVSIKLVLIGVFLFFTSPIATHAVAQVAYKSGVVPVGRNLARVTDAKNVRASSETKKRVTKSVRKAKAKSRGTS